MAPSAALRAARTEPAACAPDLTWEELRVQFGGLQRLDDGEGLDELGEPAAVSPGPVAVVRQAIRGSQDDATLVDTVAGELRLPSATARALAHGVLATAVARETWCNDGDGRQRLLARGGEELLAALAAAPTDPRVVDAVAMNLSLLVTEGDALPESLSQAVALLDDRDGEASALRLAERLSSAEGRGLPFLALLLEHAPDDATLLAAAANQARDHAWPVERLAFEAAALTAASAALGSSTALLDELRRRRVAGLLQEGLTDEATRVVMSLSQDERSRLLSTSRAAVGDEGRLPVSASAALRPLELTLALALEGERTEASAILRATPTSASPTGAPADRYEAERNARSDAAMRLLAAVLIEAPRGDVFPTLVDILQSEAGWNEMASSRTYRRAIAAAGQRGGYPQLASFELDLIARTAATYGSLQSWGLRLPFSVQRELAAAAAQRDTLLGRLAAEREAPEGADAMHALIDASLRRPRLAPFRESAMPTGEAVPAAPAPTPTARGNAPPGTDVVRFERRDDTAVAIAASQAFDPVGEVSRGAYWVYRSDDGGRSWRPPLYTGLRLFMPYVVQPSSALPMIGDDGLQMEVEVREIDQDQITFPPIGVRAKRMQTGLVLDVPWAELERDSDGDGLTDLEEERFALDPATADSDGDGLSDGDDPLPQVRLSNTRSRRAEALAALLDHLGAQPSGAIIHEIVGQPADVDEMFRHLRHDRTTGPPRTLFVEGDRRDFASLGASVRLLVYSRHELEAMQKKLGITLPFRVPLLMIDAAGEHAYAVWDAGWRGGECRLERRPDGTWTVEEAGGWIT